MLKQRIITAIALLLVLACVVLFTSPIIFCGFLGFILSVAAWEWANLCHIHSMFLRVLYSGGVIFLGVAAWLLIESAWIPFWTIKSALSIACVWWALALLWVQSYPSSSVLWRPTWVRMCMGLLVLLPTWLGLTFLRSSPSGMFLVFSVVLIVAVADSGAYFSGRAFGKRKLAPNVSPGKSWEGVFGGLMAVVLLGIAFSLLNPGQSLVTVLAILIPTALVSVLGDLLESMLKRHRGIKDSSQLLPGHGGILDRVDGLVAAVPVFALAIIVSEWHW